MISVVTWLWNNGFRAYLPEHVNALGKQLALKMRVPYRFICIADSQEGLNSALVTFYRTPAAAAALGELRSPEGARFPACYRRLWMFSKDAQVLGERVLLTDLDILLTGDISALLNYEEDFVGWRPRMRWGDKPRIGGGIYLLRTGTRRFVWEEFDVSLIRSVRAQGYRGSDQAWLSYCLGVGQAYWPEASGIYSIRDLKEGALPLPADATLVQFNGTQKPWNSTLPWVRQHWP